MTYLSKRMREHRQLGGEVMRAADARARVVRDAKQSGTYAINMRFTPLDQHGQPKLEESIMVNYLGRGA